jgi:hypothetical protein
MALTPNIGLPGRIARGVCGFLMIALAVALWIWQWPTSTLLRVSRAVALLAAGVFQLFEAKRGWCVMRACGIRTPM